MALAVLAHSALLCYVKKADSVAMVSGPVKWKFRGREVKAFDKPQSAMTVETIHYYPFKPFKIPCAWFPHFQSGKG